MTPNYSLNRTRNGMPTPGLISFWAKQEQRKQRSKEKQSKQRGRATGSI